MSTNTDPQQKPLTLSTDEVAQLLQGPSADAINSVASNITQHYSTNSISAEDKKAAEQIFRLILRETETRVRVNLAEKLKLSSNLPRDLAMTMACDIHEVALPILEFSQVFTDDDLIDIVHSSDDTQRLVAIAKRDTVSTPVSESLVQKNNEDVAGTLVDNAGAEISERSLARIVERYPENKVLMSALVSRTDLTPTIAERMVHLVSESLAKTLQNKYDLPQQDIHQQMEKVREDETLTIIRRVADLEEVEKLVRQLKAHDRLTSSLVLSALCEGNLTFFHVALARLAGLSLANAKQLINDRGNLGFRALYNKSGLSEKMFPAIHIVLQALNEMDLEKRYATQEAFADDLAQKVITLAEKNKTGNLSYVLALIRKRQLPD